MMSGCRLFRRYYLFQYTMVDVFFQTKKIKADLFDNIEDRKRKEIAFIFAKEHVKQEMISIKKPETLLRQSKRACCL